MKNNPTVTFLLLFSYLAVLIGCLEAGDLPGLTSGVIDLQPNQLIGLNSSKHYSFPFQ